MYALCVQLVLEAPHDVTLLSQGRQAGDDAEEVFGGSLSQDADCLLELNFIEHCVPAVGLIPDEFVQLQFRFWPLFRHLLLCLPVGVFWDFQLQCQLEKFICQIFCCHLLIDDLFLDYHKIVVYLRYDFGQFEGDGDPDKRFPGPCVVIHQHDFIAAL